MNKLNTIATFDNTTVNNDLIKGYTYLNFSEDVINLLSNGEIERDKINSMLDKAQALFDRENHKADYNKTRKRTSKSKVSELTLEKAKAVNKVLKVGEQNALTGSEINGLVKEYELTALEISNLMKYIDKETAKTKKIVNVTNKKGLSRQASHTAYFIVG